ncbi:hypothetical protein TUBRATIS_22380 [Tubulinosema ratisbonensis]|uniref:Myb-like domain-containing protein n=1 Tax=Tubulinosema ratisbonensis TaxID=291195 RepID=A0A437AJI0_9MICR|nr:hypothetical protein TUBRATIS_22380 [Tubulinosema ratisbonensis]
MLTNNPKEQKLVDFLNNTFILHSEAKELTKNTSLVVKVGTFSNKEKLQINKEVNEFLAQNNLKMSDLQKCLMDYDRSFPLKDLSTFVASRMNFRTNHTIYAYIIYNFHPSTKKPWTKDEEVELLELVKKTNSNWKVIARKMLRNNKYLRKIYMTYFEEKVPKELILKLSTFYKIDLSEEEVSDLGKECTKIVKLKIEKKASDVYIWDDKTELKFCIAIFLNNYFTAQEIFSFLSQKYENKELKEGSFENISEILCNEFDNGFKSGRFDFLQEDILSEDIFWSNLRLELRLPTYTFQAKFRVICSINKIITYENLLAHILKLYKNMCIEKKKNELINELKAKKNKRAKEVK